MSNFKVGDKVVCIDGSQSSTLVEGMVYEVVGTNLRNMGFVKVRLPNGADVDQYAWRFKAKPKYSTPNGKHKWHDVIVAWAEGADIQYRLPGHEWKIWNANYSPTFGEGSEYRIKPEKSDALIAAENQLAEAEKAVQAAMKAVQQAQEGK